MTAGAALIHICISGQRRHNIVAMATEKGGDDNPLSEQEDRVANENGFALRFPHNRSWLKGVINDPMSHVFERNRTAFVRKAREELGVSRRTALALYSLFKIRGTEALARAFERYENREDEAEQE